MKRFVRLVFAIALVALTWIGAGYPQAAWAEASLNNADAKLATEFGKKIDLNNTNISNFKAYRGLYPTLAQKIIANAPYSAPEEVLKIGGLSDRQQSLLKDYLDAGTFTVTEQDPIFNEGDHRINDGVYK
ncbi:MAG: photosystem II complex extrinsic protein PsbU [Limnothrix sp.]|uniref:photosystem II complex extrinsic protein PsbU n=1 Tax=unclassified Limnothrix TaxID=2632864 RepID=UPI00081DBD13|nr:MULTISPECIES: photosystem II complex extrinsic protein PsbU [unclassified Limnothrix]MEB3117453.1 photosystem II complex extrinsic protein PsbU [Limnothrix sp.]OCQ89242.1 hypothetical protein BCR12_00980 [Limnothrix sp. P13C2]MBD2160501.1 photosystem II complex extrinsic protein PsbU [Limnothrix sp. FACHB-1083]MBD2191202.1 photosystem II complex extrinsic protein PsbU [Limnothrix sp. FACHB-1088]MBD2552163.1 photosystem II complex extrinsic protein PsbU [Limnothrix sp. FACHB-708]